MIIRDIYNKKNKSQKAQQTLISWDLSGGAGDGNRTHVTSLEGWNSTIELHPQLTNCILPKNNAKVNTGLY